MALFGRKINQAENQLAFIHFLRLIADGEISAEEGVRAYHGVLQQLRIQPHRSLDDDLQLQTNVMSYGGNGVALSPPLRKQSGAGEGKKVVRPPANAQSSSNGEPDFASMTPAQKIAYHRAKWDRILG